MKLAPAVALVFALVHPALSSAASNQWTLLHEEDASGGKRFARAISAEPSGAIYLWGTGGAQPARNLYERYELESFDPEEATWRPAFPTERADRWAADDFPPFRIYGQGGPDGLGYDEGPRLETVGGYHQVNRVRWWDFGGVVRPSPILTFNMACWDSRRHRAVYYADGQTLALDPRTNHWTDLEAQNHPVTCRHLAWASMAYDPIGDRILLFGGGLGTNPQGGAPTWAFDCKTNRWNRVEGGADPPLRCNGALAYDPATRSMVLFGGYDQASALNDTWHFDCGTDTWQRSRPALSPPPMEAPAFALLAPGKILVCGNDARAVSWRDRARTSARKETWLYDVAAKSWIPLDDRLELPGYEWLTACPGGEPDTALMVAFGETPASIRAWPASGCATVTSAS